MLHFDHSPDLEKVGKTFWKSSYFGVEAMDYREQKGYRAGILIAQVHDTIAGALTWSIYSSYIPDPRLYIGMIEVHSEYRGRSIWAQLLLEAERYNIWKYSSCMGYLNNASNHHSRNMFLKAWYTQSGKLGFYK